MHESYRIVCWFGSQYIFEILGIDIGVIGDRGPGKYHQSPHGERNKLIKKSMHQVEASIYCHTTASNDMSMVSTSAQQFKTTWHSRSHLGPPLL
jgi:hypothetical protein